MKIEVYSPTIRRKEMDAVLTAMVEEKIGPGDRSRLLIQTAKEHLKFDFALALRSSAVALQLALKSIASGRVAVNVRPVVVISALSPKFYLQVLEDMQLTPLFCDVSYDFPCMSRESIENAISRKPEGSEVCAIVLHHTMVFIPDAAGIAELGFPIIEDISQSYGSWLKPAEKKDDLQKVSDNAGDNASKPKDEAQAQQASAAKTSGIFCILGLEERDMLTCGGGALLFAMNRRDGTTLRNYSNIADEYCLPDINAALAVVQFKEVQRNIERRREIARLYAQSSLQTRHKRFAPLTEDEYNNFSFSLVLETGLKDVIAYARKKEIIVESAFENTLAGSGLCENCPVSASLVLRTVLFPMYPRLSSQEAQRVSRLIMTLP